MVGGRGGESVVLKKVSCKKAENDTFKHSDGEKEGVMLTASPVGLNL